MTDEHGHSSTFSHLISQKAQKEEELKKLESFLKSLEQCHHNLSVVHEHLSQIAPGQDRKLRV
jgi:prephenate dehydratase